MPTTAKDIATTYPVASYRFQVLISGENEPMGFSEVSGLELGYELITYKDGLGIKYMPGMPTAVNLSLKKGVVQGDSKLYKWISSVKLNRVEKKDVSISLLDENNEPLITWTARNAFPTKLSAPSFSGSSNEVAIESLDLTADSIVVENESK